MILIDGREVQFETFPNGETLVVAESIFDNVSVPQQIQFKYESDADLIKLMLVKRHLDQSKFIVSPVLVIYYMPYSRMDRSENGSVFTLKYVADFINCLGFRKVFVIEPHSDVTCAVVNNSEPYYVNFDLLPKVEEMVGFNPADDYLFFPDAGAQKRYAKLNGYKQLVGFKHRDFATGEIKSLEVVGKLSGGIEKVIIVDDLSSYGGTFVHSATKLREMGFTKIYLLVAHAENSIFKKELLKGDLIDKAFTTDTILTDHKQNWVTTMFKGKLGVFPIRELI